MKKLMLIALLSASSVFAKIKHEGVGTPQISNLTRSAGAPAVTIIAIVQLNQSAVSSQPVASATRPIPRRTPEESFSGFKRGFLNRKK